MNTRESEVSIGASDSLIIAISITGFTILATTFYFVLLRPVGANAEGADGDANQTNHGVLSYEQLKRTKGTELNRAQRRARARTIAREETKSLGTKEERQRKQRDIELRERHAEQDEIDRLQEQQLQHAAKEKARRNAEKEQMRTNQKEVQLEQWETFVKKGADVLLSVADLTKMLRKHRTLHISHVSDEYGLPEESITRRLKELVHDGRIAGVFSKNQFVYFSDEELKTIANELEEGQKTSFSELADYCQHHIAQDSGDES